MDRVAVRVMSGILVLCAASVSHAHSWYPRACCTDQDCFPVTAIERRGDGSMVLTTDHLRVVVPKGLPVLSSLDNDAHVGVYRNMLGQYVPRCVFMPGVI